jgi:site-specific DNA-cytosine methylase
MKVLELFSGTHSIGVVCKELGYDCVSVDRDIGDSCKVNPNYVSLNHIKTDILEWDYKTFEPGSFDIITASPVCTWWSNVRKCNYGRILKGYSEPFSKKLYYEDIDKYGKPMVDKVFEILEYFKPKYWWIENPKTSLMWKYIKEIKPEYDNYKTFDYCKFSDWGYKKPTTFLSNIQNVKEVKCKNDCENMLGIRNLHKVNLASSALANINGIKKRVISKEDRASCKNKKVVKQYKNTTKIGRYRIPSNLIKYFFSHCV